MVSVVGIPPGPVVESVLNMAMALVETTLVTVVRPVTEGDTAGGVDVPPVIVRAEELVKPADMIVVGMTSSELVRIVVMFAALGEIELAAEVEATVVSVITSELVRVEKMAIALVETTLDVEVRVTAEDNPGDPVEFPPVVGRAEELINPDEAVMVTVTSSELVRVEKIAIALVETTLDVEARPVAEDSVDALDNPPVLVRVEELIEPEEEIVVGMTSSVLVRVEKIAIALVETTLDVEARPVAEENPTEAVEFVPAVVEADELNEAEGDTVIVMFAPKELSVEKMAMALVETTDNEDDTPVTVAGIVVAGEALVLLLYVDPPVEADAVLVRFVVPMIVVVADIEADETVETRVSTEVRVLERLEFIADADVETADELKPSESDPVPDTEPVTATAEETVNTAEETVVGMTTTELTTVEKGAAALDDADPDAVGEAKE